jgi:hypothetical protein
MLSQQIQIMVLSELAETYYYWAVNVPSRNDEYMKQLSYYEKYMTLTDYSLDSRMRHADLLLLKITKLWK